MRMPGAMNGVLSSYIPRVLKFGGSSLATPERIRAVAKLIAEHKADHAALVVVVSAMGDATDHLIDLAGSVSPRAQERSHRRELDMLVSTGERVSMSLLSMALLDLGVEAVSLTGSQSGIITDTIHGEARISEIRPTRIVDALSRGCVVIVAGFQGVSAEKEITTLGRGGSDTSAVALAIALKAPEVFIYTDVASIYSADPRVDPSAKPIPTLPYVMALEGAARGAQVLHPRCVELAWSAGVSIYVLSSFVPYREGIAKKTVVCSGGDQDLEKFCIQMKVHQKNLVRARLNKKDMNLFMQEAPRRGIKLIEVDAEGDLALVLLQVQAKNDAEGLPVESWDEGLERFSLLGSGLSRSPDVYLKVLRHFEDAGMQVASSKMSAHAIEVVFKNNSKAEMPTVEAII